MRHLKYFIRFLAAMFRSAGHRATVLLLWLILNSLLEGLGLLLLIPLLNAAGVQGTQDFKLPFDFSKRVVSFAHLDPLLIVLIIYVTVMVIKALVSYRAAVYSSWFQARFVARFRIHLYDELLRSPWLSLSALKSHDITFQLNTNMQQIAQAAYQTMLLLNNALLAMAYIAFTLWIAPVLVLILIPLGALLCVGLARTYRGTVEHAAQRVQFQRRLEAKSQNFIRRFRQIRIFGNQESERIDQAQIADAIAEKTVSVTRSISAAQAIQTTIAVIVLALIAYATLRVLALEVAELLILLYAFARLLPKLIQLQQNSQHVLAMMPAYQSLSEFQESLGRPADRGGVLESAHASTGAVEVPVIQSLTLGSIHIPGRLHLEAGNLTLHRSQISVLIGESGAGKSTLCDVLTGFLPGMEDSLINGQKPDRQQLARFFAQTAYLEQSATIWQETVRTALLWACPQAGTAELLHVIEQVGLDGLLKYSSDGLDTPIGDSAHWLSGGELKRLALARLLLRSPQVMVLDEFTANLDRKSESRLLALLYRLKEGRMILLVSHRQAVRRLGDAVWELGRTREGGNWIQRVEQRSVTRT